MNYALVTGGAGFLGFHLCEKLLKEGYQVIAVDNYLTGQVENIQDLIKKYAPQFTFINADISLNLSSWEFHLPHFKFEKLQYVFHFASVASPHLFKKYSLEILAANSTGLLNAIHLADKFQARVIFASTSEIYGSEQQSSFAESNWGYVNSYGDRSCYDEAKRFGESLIFSSNQKNDTCHGLVRIFNTYGPRMRLDDERVIPHFITQALKNVPLTIHKRGLQTRSFCYVDDLIEGLFIYAKKGIKTPVNIGNDREISIFELAHLVNKILKKETCFTFQDERTDDPPTRRPNLSLASELLKPWASTTPIEEGLKRTSQYMKEKLFSLNTNI